MITVREANPAVQEDLEDIYAGAMQFAVESQLQEYLPKTDDELRSAIKAVVELSEVTVFLAYDGGRFVGAVGLNRSILPWNPSLVVQEELFFWIEPEADRKAALLLIRAAERLAKNTGVQARVWSALSTSPEKISRVYQKMGMRPMHISYIGPV